VKRVPEYTAVNTSMIATLAPSVPATRWHPWRHRPYPSLYLDVAHGQGITSDGTVVSCPPRLPLGALVQALPPWIEAVHLCGDLPSASQVTAANGGIYSPYNSWLLEASPKLVHLDSGEDHSGSFVRIDRCDGRTVEVRPIACWLGTNDVTPEVAYRALILAQAAIRRQSGWADTCLLTTPGLTGRELWRTTIPYGKAYPILPQDCRDLIRHTEGQGRFELLPPPASLPDGLAPELVYLDGRFMYAAPALTEEIGIGPVIYDRLPIYEGFGPGRYSIRFRIPFDWHHVGLFMVPLPDDPRAALRASRTREGLRRWYFPSAPGMVGETWADAAELRIAFAPFPHRCPDCAAHYKANDGTRCPLHSWEITILERLIFTKDRPLRGWAERLVAARDCCEGDDLAQATLRSILLHAIGGFHSQGAHLTAASHDPAAVPANIPADMALAVDGSEIYTWELPAQPPRFPDYQRPELSAQVWGRTRARLLLHRTIDGTFTGALTLPLEQIVAFRLDALYVTVDPGWPDNGRPGVLRVKGKLAGPVPWPREEADLAAVKESRR
jgi:hypothetical protein